MSLRQEQSEFAKYVAILISFIFLKGYEVTFGDAFATRGHTKNSFHYKRLAIDLNLFKDGEYIRSTEGHRVFGKFWESLHPKATWGGHFDDGNHYSWGEINRSNDADG